jgi:hypothetical protein
MDDPGWLRANTVTPLGRVTLHEVTQYGLHRIRVELGLDRPNAELWLRLVPDEYKVMSWHVDEEMVGDLAMWSLWMYVKKRVHHEGHKVHDGSREGR